MHSHTLSAGVEPLHDGVLLGRLLLLGEEVGLGDVVRQRRFGYVDLLASLKPFLFPEQSKLLLDCGSYCEMILKFPSYDIVNSPPSGPHPHRLHRHWRPFLLSQYQTPGSEK